MDVFNLMISFNLSRSAVFGMQLTSCPELLPPISMLAPPCVGEAPPLVPLICEGHLSFIKTRTSCPIRTYLNVSQLHTVTIAARPIHGGRVSRSIRHGSSHHQSRPLPSRGIPLSRNFLIRSGEEDRLGDKVLLTGAQAEHVSLSSAAEKLIESVRDGICGIRVLA